MENCIFCQVISGKLSSTKLYEDEDVVVIKDIHPQASIHWLVMPKKHTTELIAAADDLIAKLMKVIKKIIKAEEIRDYRIVNNGQGAAIIDHLHFHVMGNIDKNRKL